MKNIIFYLGMGTLFTHELDAMANHEWRLLPLTNWMPEEYGSIIFLFIHIPLFAVLIALVASNKLKVRNRSKIGISFFLVVHGILHVMFIGTAGYEFVSISSNVLIFGGMLFGIIHLILEFVEKRDNSG